jgi:hypothetical protein
MMGIMVVSAARNPPFADEDQDLRVAHPIGLRAALPGQPRTPQATSGTRDVTHREEGAESQANEEVSRAGSLRVPALGRGAVSFHSKPTGVPR